MDEPGTLQVLTPGDAGEVRTLQRAAFVTEVQAHQDLHIPALTQTLADLHAELGERRYHGWVIREAGRLVGCIHPCHPFAPLARSTRLGGLGMEPSRLFPITVEYGGWALLGFLTGRDTLGLFREQFCRAGHAHAGVLLILSLVYFDYLGRAGYSPGVQWLAGALLLGGVLAQSGGLFVHLGFGQQGCSSAGTMLTRAGALLIAAALVTLAVGLITSG